MNIQSTSQAQALNNIAPVRGKDSDGDNDGSKAAVKAPSVGPAVLLSLSNSVKAPDAAAGDPDHDGR